MKLTIPLPRAKHLADRIVETLTPGCDRIEIAGSIRRENPVVGDIEIVCIPKFQHNLFNQPVTDMPTKLDLVLNALVQSGRLLSPTKNGSKFKQFGVPAVAGLTVDLFITTAEQWGVIFALRTGPAEYSKRLVTPRSKGGLLPDNCRVAEGRVWREGIALPTPSEIDFFKLTGYWIPPAQRG